MLAGFRAAYDPYRPTAQPPGVDVADPAPLDDGQDTVPLSRLPQPSSVRRSEAPAPPAVPDSPVPDSPVPDSPVPDSPVPDSPVPDSPVPDSPVPDSPVPDSPVPDSPVPLRLRARRTVGRAVAGAALSVCGVVLGLATLLWVTDDPSAHPDVPPQPAATQVQAADPVAPDAPDAAPVPPPVAEPARPSAAPPSAAPPSAAPPSAAPPSAAPPSAAPPSAAAAQLPAPVVVPVTVLNNSRIAGLAGRGAQQFRDGGWPVAGTGNFRGRLAVTTVYYPPGQQAAARAFAERFPAVGRVLPRTAGLPGSGLTVVLTRDFR